MKRLLLAPLLLAGLSASGATLFSKPAETKWNVTSASKPVGTITLLTDGSNARAEWKSSANSPATIYVATSGKIWMKAAGGDVELGTTTGAGVDRMIIPSLLLPATLNAKDKVTSIAGKISTYSFTLGSAANATYKHDTSGVSTIELSSGGKSYQITRTAFTSKKPDATLFAIRPKKGTTTRISRLAGDLLGPSDSSVSATAGSRGVERGAEFSDGGDYSALRVLEARDAAWKKNLDTALAEFQRAGSIGPARGDQ